MEMTKGAINFPFDFDYSLMPANTYIILDNFKKNSLMDNVENKYIKEIQIIHTGGPVFQINITYMDDSYTVRAINLPDIPSYLSGRITEIKTVGFIKSDSNNITLTTALKSCVDETVNCIFYYLLNSDKHTVDKDIILVNCDYVEYNRFTSHKNIVLNVKQTAFDDKYNYVFLNVLNRYYYVSDAVLQNDIFTLTLKEDVLMSFKDMILSQYAYILRNENLGDDAMFDNMVVYATQKRIEITEITPLIDVFKVSQQDTVNENLGGYILTTVG